jgi:hypothetical protein
MGVGGSSAIAVEEESAFGPAAAQRQSYHFYHIFLLMLSLAHL